MGVNGTSLPCQHAAKESSENTANIYVAAQYAESYRGKFLNLGLPRSHLRAASSVLGVLPLNSVVRDISEGV